MSLWTLLATSPGLFVGTVFILGLLVGSFLNVVIHRLPIMLETEFRRECHLLDQDEVQTDQPRYNLITPRSACPACRHPIAARDNIPLLSWLWLRGKCRHCRTPIPVRYPLVELTCGLLSAALALKFGWSVQAAGAIVLGWFLLALFCIDLDTYLLPDDLTLPLLWVGLTFNLWHTFASLHAAVVGAIAGYLVLWSVYWLFRLLTGKEGMGYGDFKLLAALGAWLGWANLPAIILLSSIAGSLIGISLTLLARRDWGKPLPFGPYLAVGGLVTLVWGADFSRFLWGS